MGKDWTEEELQAASKAMKAAGQMSYEDFCKAMKEGHTMNEVKFNLEGTSRKALAAAISEITGQASRYMKVPTCAYKIGDYTITKDGSLTWGESTADSGAAELITALAEKGFQAENAEGQETDEAAQETASDQLVIELPRESMSDTALANLDRIIESKGNLLKKALGTDSLTYEITEDRISFPWFNLTGSADEAATYTQLVDALARMARDSKRITAKEREVINEKYTFRCFLLRLGFIGGEYQTARRILLRNLEGNSAWKGGKK